MNQLNVWLHGALSSPISFAYLSKATKKIGQTDLFLSYDIQANSNEIILAQLEDQLTRYLRDNEVDRVRFIGHSFGGVYAVALVDKLILSLPVDTEIITLSSPFGGSGFASILSWLQGASNFISNVSAMSSLIKNISLKSDIWCKVTSVITTAGVEHPLLIANDLVVSVKSQMALVEAGCDVDIVEIDLNHFEVLLSEDVAKLVKDLLK